MDSALAPYEARPMPARQPDEPELRTLLAELVAELPALPREDTADRYGARAVTRSWLQGMSSHQTRRSYWRGLTLWLSYCDWQRVDPLAARLADVKDWIAELDPASPVTYNARLAAVSSWYTELIDNRAHDDNPARLVTRHKRTKESRTRALGYEELVALLGHARARAERPGTESALRNLAILEIMATTGVRSGAILHARLGHDLALDQGHWILRYINKGGHRKTADVLGFAERALADYLAARAEREGKPVRDLEGWLFATRTGTALTSRDLGNLFHATARAAGIADPGDVVPHSMRHTVLTLGYENGVAIEDLADLAGHESTATTLLYVRRSRRRQTTQLLADLVGNGPAPETAPARHLRVVRSG
ncbi:tyrosine-type recombinase/integrase [Amycolatopsis sp. GM8]|uniref:tyrosine-type recombinase/integrase n=1 Tax=Amycolatopsis sp. GM8 TaxID=2896530 RepID=UPI001F000DA8|nr:tyrosine-type recombinase/integrase [Amycolatopsis sp. GM8]